jgi:hypothetical protein
MHKVPDTAANVWLSGPDDSSKGVWKWHMQLWRGTLYVGAEQDMSVAIFDSCRPPWLLDIRRLRALLPWSTLPLEVLLLVATTAADSTTEQQVVDI